MEEKYMVNDILETSKADIISFTNAIILSENPEVKQTLEQLRTSLESFYFELYTLATSKGYYSPTFKATPEEISNIRKLFI